MQNTQRGLPNKMQWFFLILVALWILAATVLPLIAFYLARNPLYFSGFSALGPPTYIAYRIVHFLFPKDDRDYELEKTKARYRAMRKRG